MSTCHEFRALPCTEIDADTCQSRGQIRATAQRSLFALACDVCLFPGLMPCYISAPILSRSFSYNSLVCFLLVDFAILAANHHLDQF